MKPIRLSSIQLKLIGIVFMLLEHIYIFFGEALNLPSWLSWLTHFVAPLFLYILTEGYFHTSSKRNYAIRLLIGLIVMTLINLVNNYFTYIHNSTGQQVLNPIILLSGYNIFQTFLLFFLMYYLLDSYLNYSRHSILKFLGIITLGIGILVSDAGPYLLPLGLIFYAVKSRKRWSALSISVFSLLLLAKSLISYLNFGFLTGTLFDYLTIDNQFTMIIAALLIAIYSGERGGNGSAWQKSIFYIFYPLHFIIIYTILYFM